MNETAAAANETFSIISYGDLKNDGITATCTKFPWSLTRLIRAAQYKGLIVQ